MNDLEKQMKIDAFQKQLEKSKAQLEQRKKQIEEMEKALKDLKIEQQKTESVIKLIGDNIKTLTEESFDKDQMKR